MKIEKFRENIGTVVVLRPRPKFNGAYIKESMNSWIIIEEAQNAFLLQNTITAHKFFLFPDSAREFRSPDFLILAAQATLKDGGGVELEPFAPGLKEGESALDLVDEATRPLRNSIYEALKTHIGKEVTLRFPDKGDCKYGAVTAVLDKCTPNFITVRRQALTIDFSKMYGIDTKVLTPATPQLSPAKAYQTTIPEQTASVPLDQVSIAEDVEHKRPMIVFDHSFWDREL